MSSRFNAFSSATPTAAADEDQPINPSWPLGLPSPVALILYLAAHTFDTTNTSLGLFLVGMLSAIKYSEGASEIRHAKTVKAKGSPAAP